ncbi:MAG: DUF6273 domain-containing protein [Micrococcales bacterium]|nr:DUF6273 domain-containing protein [Micrococcales bacterium]MCL2667412.1 DUF6273 domain-containing protein [Micrococcales bacterium]
MGIVDRAQDEPEPPVSADAVPVPDCLRLEARVAALEAAVARLEGGAVAGAPGAPPWGTPPVAPPKPEHPDPERLGRTGIVNYQTRPPSTVAEVTKVCRKVAATWSAGSRPVRLSGIDWRVLEVVDTHRALLFADRVIGTGPYHMAQEDVTWEQCDLRRWLNTEFFWSLGETLTSRVLPTTVENAPNPVYGTRGCGDTTDGFFLLSMTEAAVQFTGREPSNWKTYQLSLGKNARAKDEKGESAWWWLRSPGGHPGGAASVYGQGDLYEYGRVVSVASGGVRPAFWLNLQS